MSEYLSRFKSCGENVQVAGNVHIEHPQAMELGDNVTFMAGVHIQGQPKLCRIGSHVTFYPNCFVQGSPDRFIVEDHVGFYPGTYLSLGGEQAFLEVGHHSHFAAGCALYSAAGLKVGPYCNVAAHVVITTIGHDPDATDKPMALSPAKSGPITLEDPNSKPILYTRPQEGRAYRSQDLLLALAQRDYSRDPEALLAVPHVHLVHGFQFH